MSLFLATAGNRVAKSEFDPRIKEQSVVLADGDKDGANASPTGSALGHPEFAAVSCVAE